MFPDPTRQTLTPSQRPVIATHPLYSIRDNSGGTYASGQAPLSAIENNATRFAQLTGHTMNVYICADQETWTYVCSYSVAK